MDNTENKKLSEDRTLARLIFEIWARYYNNPEINPPPEYTPLIEEKILQLLKESGIDDL